jgi:hypothetical protein
MNSRVCPECGLLNFASATECKRCHVIFHQPGPIPDTSPLVSEPSREPAGENQHQTPLAPLPDYFNNEPAPFSEPVILFAALLAMTVLVVGYQFKLCFAFMSSNTWDVMTDPGFSGMFYTPVIEPLVYMELIVKSAEMAAALALLILLWRRSWLFIKWVRVYLLAGLVYQVVEIAALLSLRATLPNEDISRPFNLLFEQGFWIAYALVAFGFTVVTLFWLAYFEASERVKRIFIN